MDFLMEKTMIFLQKWRVKLGHLFTIILLFCAEPPDTSELITGTIIAFAGEAIRIAAAGMIHKDENLSRSGLYAYVRNPLYVGSFLMYLGFCIACGNPWITFAFLPFFSIVYSATVAREEAFLASKFGAEFQRFTAEVPRFFPRPWPARGAGKAKFSWKQAAANKEYEGAIATGAVLLLLWIMGLTGWSPLAAILNR